MNRTTKWVWGIIGVLVVGGLLAWWAVDARTPGKYDDLAVCLKDKGVIFYGAFWCQHCAKQKDLFGRKSAKLLPYTECSTPNGRDQTPVCIEAGITTYPTWQFPDGSRLSQTLEPSFIAERAGCPVPVN